MDISGIGSINNKINSNTVNNTMEKAVSDSFEERLKSAMEKKDEKELKKVCQQFEGILLGMLYKEMKATVPKSGLLQDDYGKEIFQSMLDEKLVDEASKNGGFGLSNTMFKQLSRHMNVYKQGDGGETGIVDKKK